MDYYNGSAFVSDLEATLKEKQEKMELLKDIESIIPPGLQIELDSALIQNLGGELINNLAKESVYSSRLDFFKKDDTAKEIAEQQKKIQDLIAIEHSYSIKK